MIIIIGTAVETSNLTKFTQITDAGNATCCDSYTTGTSGGHAVAWLRNYATSQKVVGSIPSEVTGFLQLT
jgi:hypothetical protein